MKLFHVSERGDIADFVPKIPPSKDVGISHPVVWAVDGEHLMNYLVPRDCPRVCFRPGEHTIEEDCRRFRGADALPVVVIEEAWLERAGTTVLWIYEFSSQHFACVDRNAGYFASCEPVAPLACRRVEAPLAELVAVGAEWRTVRDLRALATEVTRSSLAFSCIRMRNAAPLET